MERAQASEKRGYNILSRISFHLRATQDGGEKYVVSLQEWEERGCAVLCWQLTHETGVM